MSNTELLSKFEYAHIQLLPEFNGSTSCSLDYFIARCDAFIHNFKRAPAAPNAEIINEFLFNVIKSKLKGEACSILDLDANSSYERFKEKLIRKYGDARDERLLIQEISNCFQKLNEKYPNYHDRVESLKLQCASLYKINYQGAILDLKIRELEELCLNTFKAGIMEPYRSYLRYAQVQDLGQAIRVCRSYDNDRAHESYMDQLRNGHRIPQNRVTPNTSHNPFAAQNSTSHFRPQHTPQNRTHEQFTPRPFLGPQQIQKWNPSAPPNPRPFIQSNPHPSRPTTPMNRPYPTPNNIARRFAPSQRDQSYPKPMSGVSTMRGNVNSHSESHTNTQQKIPIHEIDFSTEIENEFQTHIPYSTDEDDTAYVYEHFENQVDTACSPNEQESEGYHQDFHLAQQSRSKT